MKKVFKQLFDAKNPLFLFDDDPDGLCSFLLLYLYKREGTATIAKSSPVLGEKYIEKSNNPDFDVVFVLDKPKIEPIFFNKVKKQIVWVDHHPIQSPPRNVVYYNSKKENKKDIKPTSEICYTLLKKHADKEFLEKNKKRMLWLGLVGTVGDWKIPDFIKQAKKEYPELFKSLNGKKVDLTKPEDLLFNTPLGRLIKIFNATLKGKSIAIKKRVKVLTRIISPYEILAHDELSKKIIGTSFLEKYATQAGKFVYKNFKIVNNEYEYILKNAIKSFEKQQKEKRRVLFYSYSSKTSLTSSLSNELYYLFSKKTIIVCRIKRGEMMCSFRSKKGGLPKKIEESLKGLSGYGGGHENASGANIKENEFKIFLERFENLI